MKYKVGLIFIFIELFYRFTYSSDEENIVLVGTHLLPRFSNWYDLRTNSFVSVDYQELENTEAAIYPDIEYFCRKLEHLVPASKDKPFQGCWNLLCCLMLTDQMYIRELTICVAALEGQRAQFHVDILRLTNQSSLHAYIRCLANQSSIRRFTNQRSLNGIVLPKALQNRSKN